MGINIKKPTYAKWPVKFKLSEADGSIREEEHVIHYRIGLVSSSTLGESIIGWEGAPFEDDDGSPVQCTKENITKLCDNLEIGRALTEGFYAIVRGEHLLGNSQTSSTG